MTDKTTVVAEEVEEVEEEVPAPWEAEPEDESESRVDIEAVTLVEAPPKPKARKRKTRKKPAPELKPAPVPTRREYRLELYEEGDQRVHARQRALSREGWEWPVIHGFRRKAPSGLVADSFLILVASREVDVVPEE